MSSGLELVLWCTIAGLVVVVLELLWRHLNPPGMTGRSEHERLMSELERHRGRE